MIDFCSLNSLVHLHEHILSLFKIIRSISLQTASPSFILSLSFPNPPLISPSNSYFRVLINFSFCVFLLDICICPYSNFEKIFQGPKYSPSFLVLSCSAHIFAPVAYLYSFCFPTVIPLFIIVSFNNSNTDKACLSYIQTIWDWILPVKWMMCLSLLQKMK